MQDFTEISQPAKFNIELRKQIRRKDIQKRFAQRRKQFLSLQQNSKSIINADHNADLHENQSVNQIGLKLQKIVEIYRSNGKKFTVKEINQLARISCNMAGALLIGNMDKQFLQHFIQHYFVKQCEESPQLNWATLIINNYLTVSNNQPPTTTTSTSSTPPPPQSTILQNLTTYQPFILRIFAMALTSTIQTIKQNTLSIIFCIIYNNPPSFIRTLITSSKYSLMSVLGNQVHHQPGKNVILESFRCYYLLTRKLQYPGYAQMAKMRKFINLAIKSSNCLEISILGVICLYAMIKCLPNQQLTVSKMGLLAVIYEQALALNNSKLVVHSIRLASLMVENVNRIYSDVKITVQFLDKSLQKFNDYESQIFSVKLLYDMISTSIYSVDTLLQNYPKIPQILLNLFQSDSTQTSLLIQLGICLSIIAAKSKTIQKSLIIRIKERIQRILEKFHQGIDQKNYGFLQQAVVVLAACCCDCQDTM